jgi:hypothetical protein
LAGGDEELASVVGSDDHGLYIWPLIKLPNTESLFILHGHQGSINSIRCNVRSKVSLLPVDKSISLKSGLLSIIEESADQEDSISDENSS